MAEMGRAATHHAALTTTPGWGEVDQALGKLNVRTDKDKHIRSDGGVQTELHVHDSTNWHGIGSPKEKYKEAVVLIKAAIDKDFGQGAGDMVFRNIGIKKNSQGIQLKDIAALRQEVAQLGTVGSYDRDRLKSTLQKGVNNPKIGPEKMDLGKGRTATVSGQMRRDFGSSDGYKLKVGNQVTSDPTEVARALDQMTEGRADHLLALSKIMTQQAPMAFLDSDDATNKLMLDAPNASIKFEAARTTHDFSGHMFSEQSYEVSIDYSVPVKGKNKDGDIEMADTRQENSFSAQARMHIPFDAIDGQGNIDMRQVTFDQRNPPGFKLMFHPA